VEKGIFQSILVDTAVMNLPATAFSLVANRLIKQEFGLPVGCAPANGTYMWRKSLGMENRGRFVAVDAAINAIAALASDFLFYGPMTGTSRVFPAVAAATCLLTTLACEQGNPLPKQSHPLSLLFPEVVEQLSKEEGKG
jgi:tetrahydromethanopterin S-methyltransferase subunit H